MESYVPEAVVYEGPTGRGKTFSATTMGVPLVHVHVKTQLCKFYSETTSILTDMLDAANSLGHSIVLLDEYDSLALRRSGHGQDVYEVTWGTLSVLLCFIDGMDGAQNAIVLAHTNHKDDLDTTLMCMFDVNVSAPI